MSTLNVQIFITTLMSHPCRGMSSMSPSTWKTLDNTLDPGKEKEKKEEGDAGAKENERERESHIIERQKTAMTVQTHSPTTRTRREDVPGPKSSLPAAHYSASLVSSLLAASSLLTNLPREAPRLLVRQRSDKCEATTARPTAPPPSYVHASANPPP